jgi:hypothetical protein
MDESKKMKIEKILARMEAEGKLTPDAVVERAKLKTSPLHEEFEWDDTKAGHKWRINQARSLIRTVHTKVVLHGRRVLVPTYTHDPARASEQGYRAVATLKSSDDLSREALDAELARVLSALERARGVAAALGLESRLEALLIDVMELREAAA